MDEVIKEIIIDEETIEKKVKEMAKEISDDYRDEELLVVGILKGAIIFMSDLIKAMDIPVKIDFMNVSSYGDSSVSTGEIKILKDLENDVEGKNILIVEDIIDTGYTLEKLTKNLEDRGAKSVKLCAFLDKVDRREVDVHIDYKGYVVPDDFLVGYGLDYAEKYRNLPYVAALKEEAYM